MCTAFHPQPGVLRAFSSVLVGYVFVVGAIIVVVVVVTFMCTAFHPQPGVLRAFSSVLVGYRLLSMAGSSNKDYKRNDNHSNSCCGCHGFQLVVLFSWRMPKSTQKRFPNAIRFLNDL